MRNDKCLGVHVESRYHIKRDIPTRVSLDLSSRKLDTVTILASVSTLMKAGQTRLELKVGLAEARAAPLLYMLNFTSHPERPLITASTAAIQSVYMRNSEVSICGKRSARYREPRAYRMRDASSTSCSFSN